MQIRIASLRVRSEAQMNHELPEDGPGLDALAGEINGLVRVEGHELCPADLERAETWLVLPRYELLAHQERLDLLEADLRWVIDQRLSAEDQAAATILLRLSHIGNVSDREQGIAEALNKNVDNVRQRFRPQLIYRVAFALYQVAITPPDELIRGYDCHSVVREITLPPNQNSVSYQFDYTLALTRPTVRVLTFSEYFGPLALKTVTWAVREREQDKWTIGGVPGRLIAHVVDVNTPKLFVTFFVDLGPLAPVDIPFTLRALIEGHIFDARPRSIDCGDLHLADKLTLRAAVSVEEAPRYRRLRKESFASDAPLLDEPETTVRRDDAAPIEWSIENPDPDIKYELSWDFA